MKTVGMLFSLIAMLVISATAHAQCAGGPNTACVTSFTLSPGAIIGDNVEYATGQVTAHLPPGLTNWVLNLSPANLTFQGCAAPAVAGSYVCYVSGPTVTVFFAGVNNQQAPILGQVLGYALYNNDPGITASVTINPVPAQQTPDQDPDGPVSCAAPSTCTPAGGHPINFTNGDTWITQQDYSIPGVGGGIGLTRTWNSLWSLSLPPEQSGIFGDSWRSNFEERIQVLTGGVAKYWKGDGSKLFYLYNNISGLYVLTAPADDQTTISFNTTTTLWTALLKDGTQKIFNNSGYLTSIVDRNGNTINIVVDAAHQNRIASVTDAANRTLTFNYANGTFPRLCTSITDAVGTIATYSYDASGRLTQVIYPDSSQLNFQYNDPNSPTLISGVTDAQSKIIESHTYDSQRRGLSSQQANGVNGVTVALYGTGETGIRDSRSNFSWVNFVTLAQREYLSSTTGYGCTTCGFKSPKQQFIDSHGNVVYSGDPYGLKPTQYTFDSQGNVLSVSKPYGNNYGFSIAGWYTSNYTYNSFGEVLTATDPFNHQTTNVYDTHGNLLTVTTPPPDGSTPASVTTFTYNTNGTLKTIKDPLGHITTLTYFSTGLINTIKDANSKTTTYNYDARGNRTSVIDPVNGSTKPTSYAYDSMNRLTSITYPGATTSVQFHYDYRGRRDWVQDQNGNKTTYGYDDADRVISVTDAQSPTPGVTTYGYDTENNLTDIHDAMGNHTHMDYNANAVWLSAITFPSGYVESYTWDNAFPIIRSKVDRNSQTINYNYDFQNRVWQKNYPDSTTTQFNYDAANRLSQVTDPTGTYTFTYDNMNRLTQATTDYSFDTAGALTVGYGYDAASNRTSMTDPQSLNTAYTYDVLNRLSTLAFNGQTPAFGFGYDALSRRTSLTRPNGIATSYTYDPLSGLLSVLHKLGTTTLDGASYTYDNAENRKTRTDKRLNTTLTYTYDNIYQLQTAKQGSTTMETYTYDDVGNRLSSLGVTPYMYNSSNELTSLPNVGYTYDNNGSTKTKTDTTGITTYTWDFENRLSSVALPGSGGTVNFKYDPFGRRVQKSSTSGTTNYLYDGDNLLEEVDSSGNVLARNTLGQNVDESLAELRAGTTSYYEADGLGSVTSLSNSAGALANTYSYDSFGILTASTGTITNPFRYTGRELDTETGLYYYRARYYNPSTGRFISEDPARMSGGSVNFYAYVNNNPVSFEDLFGLQSTSGRGLCQPKCFAQLKFRPVQDWRAKMIGATHSFWYVQDSNGTQSIVSGGPWPPNSGNQNLDVWKNPDINNGVDNVSSTTWWDSGLSSDNCSGVDALINAATNWPEDTIPYNWRGPNSNSAAHSLGTSGGFNPPAPPVSLGWNTPIP